MTTNPNPTADEWLTVREAATVLKVSDTFVRQMFHSGKLTGQKLGPKTIRILKSCLKLPEPRVETARPVKDYLGDE